jgi:REP element-mobilizing transposase RayT
VREGNVGQPSSAVGVAKPALAAYKRTLPHLQRPDSTLYITFSTYKRWILPKAVRQIVLDVCLVGHRRKFLLRAAVVMPDHVHLLITPGRDANGDTFGIAEIMSAIKGASAHKINRALSRKGHVWQDESFDHVLRLGESLRQKAMYLCENSVRAGLVEGVDDYSWLWREWVEGWEDSQPPPHDSQGRLSHI